MSFTPLQQLALAHAMHLTHKLQDQVYKVARLHNFACDMRNTPEHDLSQSVRDLQDIIDALLKEKK